ncbi:MAG: DUF1990 family protein [Solirubrobacterales bacterium]
MSTRLSARRRWATAVRWPLGVALASWRYMWSTTPIHRWAMTGSWPEDRPPDFPAGFDHPELQGWRDGVGPLLHRIYRTRITASPMAPQELIARLTEDMNRVAPGEFASFQRLEGEGPMRAGDDYVVRMPGPWDGPVTVVAVDETSFRLATLQGHLEAGQIEFRAASDHRGVVFEIESWARSGDRLSDLLYTHVQISKEVQLHMWASVLRNVVDLAGGKMDGGIVITTRRVDPHALARDDGDGGGLSPRYARSLATFASRPINIDPVEVKPPVDVSKWRIDEMVEPLPHEKPGAPEPGGSWEVAQQIMNGYQLSDPHIVSGVFNPSEPLSGRTMLLKIHYGPLRFKVGVRVGEPGEGTDELDGREVLAYGWSYRTLQGHFEEGEMRYELRKWLDSGDVEFRLHAVSRPARSGPLLLRLGFRLVGRNQQLRFYRQVCRRLRRLTEAQLETERAHHSRQLVP